MNKQKANFAVVTNKNGVVEKIGKSEMVHPQIQFKGGSIKWYEDKPKKKSN